MGEKALLSFQDIQALGFSRAMAYRLLNRHDLPVVKIGGRKFMHREKFLAWLAAQADTEAHRDA